MNARGRTVVLVSGNHLCHNPRVLKEADALSAAGFSVIVLGGWSATALADRDRDLLVSRPWKYVPVVDLTAMTSHARRQRVRIRVRTKLGRILGQTLRCENRWQLGYCAPELLRAARQYSADLYIAHSEPALWAVNRLARSGARMGVDMEDWYSEDFAPTGRFGRPANLLGSLEQSLLQKGAHLTCPSGEMSLALAERYGCVPPVAIYNAFPWAERALMDGKTKDRVKRDRPSIHWYSQTLGPGRGLEDLFAALRFVDVDFEVHLRGQPVAGYREKLLALVPDRLKGSVQFHDLVPVPELLSRISEHDIGFAGELRHCRSRDLTVTNKILHYLLGGLAVVASDTFGQREVAAAAPGAVSLYKAGDVASLAATLKSLVESGIALAAAKVAALRAAERTFCWEQCEPRFLASVRRALEPV